MFIQERLVQIKKEVNNASEDSCAGLHLLLSDVSLLNVFLMDKLYHEWAELQQEGFI